MVQATIEKGTLTDQNGVLWDVFTTEAFQFRVAYLQLGTGDHGPTLELMAREKFLAQPGYTDESPNLHPDAAWRELLKFDCYQSHRAHWHRCFPEGPDRLDKIHPTLEGGTFEEAVNFAFGKLHDWTSMLVEQGYAD